MTLTIELPESKILRLEERAQSLGVSTEEFAGHVMEFVADSADEDFEGWIETLEILRDKDFASHLKESIKQEEARKLTDWDEAKRELGIS